MANYHCHGELIKTQSQSTNRGSLCVASSQSLGGRHQVAPQGRGLSAPARRASAARQRPTHGASAPRARRSWGRAFRATRGACNQVAPLTREHPRRRYTPVDTPWAFQEEVKSSQETYIFTMDWSVSCTRTVCKGVSKDQCEYATVSCGSIGVMVWFHGFNFQDSTIWRVSRGQPIARAPSPYAATAVPAAFEASEGRAERGEQRGAPKQDAERARSERGAYAGTWLCACRAVVFPDTRVWSCALCHS
jgi:hypothetical protein